ncbi:MAG TPA: DinB family protein [Fimbriimonas sp.]|nr:DinB family protein [Fimbriimonas sp.]
MDSIIESSKKSAVEGMEMFLRNFSYVPDDKLNWQPTPTAKSALRIAAHTALYPARFARMINQRSLPIIEDESVWLAQVEAEEAAITTRAEMERIFRKGTAEVLAAIDGLSEEDISLSLDSGQGWSMSMRFLMGLAGWHATLHMGQIDYLQTCWGDQNVYVG